MIPLMTNLSKEVPIIRQSPDKESARLVRLWTCRVSKRLGLPGLPLFVRFLFTRNLPLVVIGRTNLRGRVSLNLRAWNTMGRRGRRRLVIHELCHVAEILKYGALSDHGIRFAGLMCRAGVEPNGIDLQAAA